MKPIINILLSMAFISGVYAEQKITYPKTRKENVVDTYFGTKVKEPYRWLENDTTKATAQWVKEENKLTTGYLGQIPFRNNLKKRLTGLYNYTRVLPPFKNNGKYYYFKNDGLQNQNVLYCQESANSEPEIILDPNTFSADGTIALSNVSISRNGKYLAYAIAKSGSDWNEIFVLDLQNRKLLSDHIVWSKSSEIAWKGDGFYYSAYDAPEAGKEYSVKNEYDKIYFHLLGQLQQNDEVIYEDKQHAQRECFAEVTSDEKYLIISITETTTGNSLLLKDLTKQNASFKEIAPGFENDFYIIESFNQKLYVQTNWKAPKNRLLEIDPNKPEIDNWKEIIPESENVLESTAILSGKIVATYMQDASNHLKIFNILGNYENEIQLPTIGSVSGLSGDKDDTEAFFSFTSYTYPSTVFRYDFVQNSCNIYQKAKVAFNPSDYVTEQVFYTSKDGTKVPMSITYKKGMVKNGNNPLMLYGYGGFNISLNPTFSVARIPFLENGGIYVVANLRGGGEYGEAWHMAGTKMKKQNVFNDFIAAAEFLIKEKYTSTPKLAIDGGSNGGLLIGACMTQRPDLYAVAIPEVGVLDMLRYHKFTIGWSWTSDYGNSEESKEMFEYLKGYSPLHNIKKGVKYPATLIMTADHDDRVVPAHSFKFAATLQAANKGNYISLIRIDSKAGHGAGKPIGKLIDAQTDMWSFVMYNLGMKPIF